MIIMISHTGHLTYHMSQKQAFLAGTVVPRLADSANQYKLISGRTFCVSINVESITGLMHIE